MMHSFFWYAALYAIEWRSVRMIREDAHQCSFFCVSDCSDYPFKMASVI